MFSSLNLRHITQHLRQMRPLTALLSVLLIIVGSLILLPLVLLFLVVGFIGMTLLSRQYLGKQGIASRVCSTATPNKDRYQQYPNIEKECSANPSQHHKTINH
ncbi:hypothetical protein [Shewanella sp.]|uniref:hypothetical protein n=1 Tax=Shewanella sp. TaxID=50422 RepID=UPI0040478660